MNIRLMQSLQFPSQVERLNLTGGYSYGQRYSRILAGSASL